MAEYFDSEGNVTTEFIEAVPGFLGDDHKDSKVMGDITSIGQLTKAYADNKSALGRKLDSVIQKPGEDATDEAKGDYAKALRSELGIQDAPENYTYPELVGEEAYRDGSKEYWGDVFKKFNISQEQATGMTAALHEMQRANKKDDDKRATEADGKLLAEDIAKIDEMYPGDKKPEALRHALAALDKYGTEALKGAIKEARLFDNHDLTVWNPLTPLNNLPFLVNVGKDMANAAMPLGEAPQGTTGPQIAAIASLNNKTVEQVQEIIAGYPNSWNDGTMLRLPK